MKFYLDVRNLLLKGHLPLPDLARDVGITLAELRHLLDTEATTVNQSHLNKVCNYLVRKGIVHESELPGVLYSKRYDSFWPMLSEREHVELITGFRRGDSDWREIVSAADSLLQFNVQYRLTGEGNRTRTQVSRRLIDARLVQAWDFSGDNHDEARAEAGKLHRAFLKERRDRGLVLFGSVKSNPVVELSIANAFRNAIAFKPQDDVTSPDERACPFMILYRKEDPKPPSCCGGVQLSAHHKGNGPGFYYAAELGEPWEHIPSNDECDAGLVFYRFDKSDGNQLEMVLGGFSGRATHCLANYLRHDDVSKFSTPVYSTDTLDLGVFIVKFTFNRPHAKAKRPKHAYERAYSGVKVIPLAKEVLVDRVKAVRRRRAKSKSRTRKGRSSRG